MQKNYRELVKLKTFRERYEYLQLKGYVGEETFGIERYLNQTFYHGKEWREFRDRVIIRDLGRDLGIEGMEMERGIVIHHIDPILPSDITNNNIDKILNMDKVICCSDKTHKAIHYGVDDAVVLLSGVTVRTPGDTCPWK